MKKHYEMAEMTIDLFELTDVICASTPVGGDGGGGDDEGEGGFDV